MGQPQETPAQHASQHAKPVPKAMPNRVREERLRDFSEGVDKGSFWSLRKGRWRLCCVIKAAKRRPKPSDPHKPHTRVDLTHMLCVCCTAMLKIRGEYVS